MKPHPSVLLVNIPDWTPGRDPEGDLRASLYHEAFPGGIVIEDPEMPAGDDPRWKEGTR